MLQIFNVNSLENLPSSSGVYYFLSDKEELLYIGKATTLKARVNSYFTRPLDNRLELMIKRAAKVKIKTTDTALEALILEANEINRLQPPFNVLAKDDKTFVTIAVTDEVFPRIVVARPTQKLKIAFKQTFGPYPSASLARKALGCLRQTFKFECRGKPCSYRPCLYWQIGLCPGVCMNKISLKDYRATIRRVVDFLQGKKPAVIKQTRKLMSEAAKRYRFEEAARLRNELFALEHIRDIAFSSRDAKEFLTTNLPGRLEAYDISNQGKDFAVGSMVVLLYGQPNPSQYRRFKIKTINRQNDLAMLREVLTRRMAHPEWSSPDFILVDGGRAQLKVAQVVTGNLNIPVAAIIKGPKRDEGRLVLAATATKWLADHRLTTQTFEPIARLARSEAHRFAIAYHRQLRKANFLPVK